LLKRNVGALLREHVLGQDVPEDEKYSQRHFPTLMGCESKTEKLPSPMESPASGEHTVYVVSPSHRGLFGAGVGLIGSRVPCKIRDEKDVSKARRRGDFMEYTSISAIALSEGRLADIEDKPMDFVKIDGEKMFLTSGLYPCSAVLYLFETPEGAYAYPLHNALQDSGGETFKRINKLVFEKADEKLSEVRGLSVIIVPGIDVSEKEAEESSRLVVTAIDGELKARGSRLNVNVHQCATEERVSHSYDENRLERSAKINVKAGRADVEVIDCPKFAEHPRDKTRYVIRL
jgi:hypothetical protein